MVALSVVFVEAPLVLEQLVAPFAIVMVFTEVVKEIVVVIEMGVAALAVEMTWTLHPVFFASEPGGEVYLAVITVVMHR